MQKNAGLLGQGICNLYKEQEMDDKLMDERKELNEILLGDVPKDSSRGKKMILMLVMAIIVIAILLAVFYKMTREDAKDLDLLAEPSIEKLDSLHSGDTDFTARNEEFENLPIDNMSDMGMSSQDEASRAEDESKFDKIVQDIKAKQLASEQKQASNNMVDSMDMGQKDLAKGITKDTMQPQSGIMSPMGREKVEPSKIKPSILESKVKAPAKTPEKSQLAKEIVDKNGSVALHGHYLQVGAFSKKPNQMFLNKIAKYSYRTQTSVINGQSVTKYLIGPYSSKTEASRDVLRVTTEISKPLHIEIR